MNRGGDMAGKVAVKTGVLQRIQVELLADAPQVEAGNVQVRLILDVSSLE